MSERDEALLGENNYLKKKVASMGQENEKLLRALKRHGILELSLSGGGGDSFDSK